MVNRDRRVVPAPVTYKRQTGLNTACRGQSATHRTDRADRSSIIETKASIANKLSRGTVGATFLLSTLAALEMELMRLEDL